MDGPDENVRKRNAATFLPLGSFSAGVTLSGTQKTMSQTSPRERTDAKASGVETAGVEKEHEINCSRDGETSQRERNDDANDDALVHLASLILTSVSSPTPTSTTPWSEEAMALAAR